MALHHRFLQTTVTYLAHQIKTKKPEFSQVRLDLIFRRCVSLSCHLQRSQTLGSLGHKVYDVVIVGGGIMGSSSAYFLANRMSREMGKICVIERDPTVSILSGLRNYADRSLYSQNISTRSIQFNSIQFAQLVISRMLKV